MNWKVWINIKGNMKYIPRFFVVQILIRYFPFYMSLYYKNTSFNNKVREMALIMLTVIEHLLAYLFHIACLYILVYSYKHIHWQDPCSCRVHMANWSTRQYLKNNYLWAIYKHVHAIILEERMWLDTNLFDSCFRYNQPYNDTYSD